MSRSVTNSGVTADRAEIFPRLRDAIGVALRSTEVRAAAARHFAVSDAPYVGGRYVSITDGHVYIVYGATDDGQELVAYRQTFWRSCISHRGGRAVAVSATAWLRGRMVLYSMIDAPLMNVADGVNGAGEVRRTLALVKIHAAYCVWRDRVFIALRKGFG